MYRPLALALGVSRVVDFVSDLGLRNYEHGVHRYLKTGSVLVLSAVAARATGSRGERFVLACEVAGLTALVHEGQTYAHRYASGAVQHRARQFTGVSRQRTPPIP